MSIEFNNVPTLREILTHRKITDTNIIDVSKHNYKNPKEPKPIYIGLINNIPEDVLNLKIIAWLRNEGIYIAE